MAKRRSQLEVVRAEGSDRLAFLSDAGMSGPHPTDDGIIYRSPSVEISISYYGRPDAGVFTTVHRMATDEVWQRADLSCLHVACGQGVLQDVPTSAPNPKVASKRVMQHAAALRRILPRLLTDDSVVLFGRCHGRQLPSPD
ncbi:hypothetical protein OWR29_26435 [Actinoplanes sp. Pm04-4]|uniref:Uncharacterized protein n=1 Tax=Paractinoplanes pyxinae TaxID=2997416 RepID=A0ABT4B4Y1_9ACTN|nr:hypothetical protein [Actinoplanes pyxinae]MCY1141551.1 hypothetical protein [Actinoplanes pyxinae]